MEELNHVSAIDVYSEDGCDPVTVVDMGEMISISQTDETERHHDICIGLQQARLLRDFLNELLAK